MKWLEVGRSALNVGSYRTVCSRNPTTWVPHLKRPTSNVKRTTSNVQRTTSNVQRPTFNVQAATSNAQYPTSKLQRPTSNDQRTTLNVQRSTFNAQRSTTADEVVGSWTFGVERWKLPDRLQQESNDMGASPET